MCIRDRLRGYGGHCFRRHGYIVGVPFARSSVALDGQSVRASPRERERIVCPGTGSLSSTCQTDNIYAADQDVKKSVRVLAPSAVVVDPDAAGVGCPGDVGECLAELARGLPVVVAEYEVIVPVIRAGA